MGPRGFPEGREQVIQKGTCTAESKLCETEGMEARKEELRQDSVS